MDITAIRTAALTIVGDELGAPYRELPYSFSIEMNEDRHLAAGYAVLWGAGSQVYVVDQVVNIEQDIEVTVTKRVFIRNDDEKIVSEADGIYSAAGRIINRFVMEKLGLPETVQEVALTRMDKPTLVGNGRDIVSLNMTFRARYLIT